MPVARSPITCTPESLLGENPCNNCYSDTILIAGLAALLCSINKELGENSSCDPEDAMEDASCFKCMSDHQMLVAIVNTFADYAISLGVTNAGEVIQNATCLSCADPKMNKAIVVKQLCTFIHYLESQVAN